MTTPRKENPYKEPDNVAVIKSTLVSFGWAKLDARKLAYEIRQNLNNYLVIQDIYNKRRMSDFPTQTKRRSDAYI
jgi:hypothetical protein